MRTDAADQKRKLRVVLILGVAQTFAWASTYYLPAVLGGSMAAELGLERPALFGLFSLALIVAAASGPLTGRMLDLHGVYYESDVPLLRYTPIPGMLSYESPLW